MTTIDAAAARNVHKTISSAAFIALLTGLVAGCTNGGDGVLSALSTNQQSATTQQASQQTAPVKGRVAIAPIIGPPNNVTAQLSTQLVGALRQGGVQAIQPVSGAAAAQSDYTLRGYIVAAKEAAGTKVSYIWDVTNPKGHRVNRITGEEIIAGAATADPWASVTPQILQAIASKTATSLSAWMPAKQAPAATPAVKPASAPATPVAQRPTSATTTAQRPAAQRVAQTAARPAPSARATGSIPRASALAVVVPRVTGAPGDGSTALALALQNELRKKGINLAAGTAVGTAHRVEGKVAVGANSGGKQPISIDWVVKDPRGAKLGTVAQKNEIPAGSLNGKWGPTASAAAAAAAQGIIRLLPQKTASR
ncbi:MAG: hypothetical protein AAF346_09625 [Pseudomonadota bacterium]